MVFLRLLSSIFVQSSSSCFAYCNFDSRSAMSENRRDCQFLAQDKPLSLSVLVRFDRRQGPCQKIVIGLTTLVVSALNPYQKKFNPSIVVVCSDTNTSMSLSFRLLQIVSRMLFKYHWIRPFKPGLPIFFVANFHSSYSSPQTFLWHCSFYILYSLYNIHLAFG